MPERNNADIPHFDTRRDFLKRIARLMPLLFLPLIGCSDQSPEQPKKRHPKQEYREVEIDISTCEGIVQSMAINAENILKDFSSSGMLNHDTEIPITPKQIGLIVSSMKTLVLGASITHFIEAGSGMLFDPENYFHNYLASTANPNHLKSYAASMYALIELILRHWDDINWNEDTAIPEKSSKCCQDSSCKVVDSGAKYSALSRFVLATQEHVSPLESSGAVESFTAYISVNKGKYELLITIEGLKEFIDKLGHKYAILSSNPPDV